MCLSPEFFDGREALIRKREAEGEIELEHFLEDRGIEIDRLYDLALLKIDRDFMTTTDLFVHQITVDGRRFPKGVSDLQLIFVKRGRARALTVIAVGATRGTSGSQV